MTNLTHVQLCEILKYDPETGQFTWLVSRPQSVGKPAGYRHYNKESARFYWIVEIGPKRYRGHRLAWFYMTGEWPKSLIDHKDCDGLNNRWVNLREADFSKNTQNSRCRSDNQSGLKGVNFSVDGWKARISIHGHRVHLGYFSTAEAAHAAYKSAAEKLFGEFARAA